MGSKTTAIFWILMTLTWCAPLRAEAQKDKSLDDLIQSVESKEGGVRPQGSRSSAIRELVRRELVRPEEGRAVDAILEVFADAYAHQREVVMLAVAASKNDEFLDALAKRGMRSKDELIRSGVTRALGLSGRPSLIDAVLRMQKDRSPLVQEAVAEALGRFGRAEDLGVLDLLGKSRDPAVRAAVARALLQGAAGFGVAAQELAGRLAEDREGAVQSLAVEALACVQGAAALDAIAEVAGDRKSEQARVGALLAYRELGRLGDTDAFEAAVTATLAALSDPSWRVRATAIDNTVELWDQRFIEPLIARMKEEDGRLRLDCAFALTLLCEKDMGTDPSGWANWWDVRKQDFQLPKQPKRGEYGFERSLVVEEGSSSFFDIPVLSKRCIFQFDFSGSMAWEIEDYRKDKGRTVSADEKTTVTKLSIAQDEAAAVVDELAPDAIFNFQIYRYLGARNPPQIDTESAFKRLSPASKKNRAAAKKWVTSREVDGWGAFYDALVTAMDDEDVDTIFLLSDGTPSGGGRADRDRFVEGLIEKYRDRRITVHTILLKNNEEGHKKFAIGFMQDVACATGGLCVLR